jgi:hypothetical protein
MSTENLPDTTPDALTALSLIRDLVDLGWRVEFQPQDPEGFRYGVTLCGYDSVVDVSDEPSPEAALIAAYKQVQR